MERRDLELQKGKRKIREWNDQERRSLDRARLHQELRVIERHDQERRLIERRRLEEIKFAEGLELRRQQHHARELAAECQEGSDLRREMELPIMVPERDRGLDRGEHVFPVTTPQATGFRERSAPKRNRRTSRA